jgi:uncharacterized protein
MARTRVRSTVSVFLKRYKTQLKRAVADAVNKRSITDMDSGEKVGIPSRDMSEPVFHHGQGRSRDMVHPGNREFERATASAGPRAGGRRFGQGRASKDGQGEDDFVFELSREEFMDLLFEDLELPNLVRNQLMAPPSSNRCAPAITQRRRRANIDVVRSLKGAVARRTAIGAPGEHAVAAGGRIEASAVAGFGDGSPHGELRAEIDRLKTRIGRCRSSTPSICAIRARQAA